MLRTQLLLKEGRTRDAAICTERIETLARDFSSDDTLQASHALARAQVLIATGDARRGATILRQLQAACCGKRNNYRALRLSVHLADALLGCGDQAKDVRCSFKRFRLVRAPGCIRHSSMPECTWPSSCCPFTRRPAGQTPAPGAQTLHRQHSRGPCSASRGALPTRASRVTESLSPREHSILRSMSCGLSNKRIAQELQIAPETVKSHVKGIFIKLAVQSRAHAVSTAGALGLL